MPDEDATLEDFVDASAGATDAESDAEATSATDAGSTAGAETAVGADEAVDPAESTYRWSGTGARCDGCGAHVERLWRDEAGLVCGDCKDW